MENKIKNIKSFPYLWRVTFYMLVCNYWDVMNMHDVDSKMI